MSIESKIKKDVSLAPLTSFQIGGPAKFFVEVETPEELVEAIGWARERSEKWFILGGGSNLLVSDKGFNGLVIKNRSNRIEWSGFEARAESGAVLARLAFDAADKGLTGLEWAAGIPGTVGGAIRGNSGAHGSSIASSIKSVMVFDPAAHETKEFSAEQCKFAYRHSLFKESDLLVLAGTIILKPGVEAEIKKLMQNYITRRSGSFPKQPNAGSIFKNFTIEQLKEAAPELFRDAEQEGVIVGGKISAGWVIGKVDFKGKVVGGAMVSLEHGNFIVNLGHATAEDVLVLMSLIKQKVRVEFKLQLINEIQFLDY